MPKPGREGLRARRATRPERTAPSARPTRTSSTLPAGDERRSLTDRVYEHIKETIVSGRRSPGQQIFEDRITSELRVSRTPVREALQRLAFEGLVDVRAHKGSFVSVIDDESLREIFEFREVIEGQAARLATLRMEPQTHASLEALLGLFDKAAASGDPRRFHEADTRLHRMLVSSCGNRRIQRTVEILESQIARTRFFSIIALGRMERSSSEHEAIVKAVVRGDARGAEETMRTHIRAVYENLVENLDRFVPAF